MNNTFRIHVFSTKLCKRVATSLYMRQTHGNRRLKIIKITRAEGRQSCEKRSKHQKRFILKTKPAGYAQKKKTKHVNDRLGYEVSVLSHMLIHNSLRISHFQ